MGKKKPSACIRMATHMHASIRARLFIHCISHPTGQNSIREGEGRGNEGRPNRAERCGKSSVELKSDRLGRIEEEEKLPLFCGLWFVGLAMTGVFANLR